MWHINRIFYFYSGVEKRHSFLSTNYQISLAMTVSTLDEVSILIDTCTDSIHTDLSKGFYRANEKGSKLGNRVAEIYVPSDQKAAKR